jgi:hypothetical protein
MRLWAALTFVLAFAALLAARYVESGPLWLDALWALPLCTTLFAVALLCALLEYLLGAGFRAVAPAIALALGLFALLYAVFERAPGTMPSGLPLLDLWPKTFSLMALGATASALVLAIFGLRAPFLASQLCSALALGEVAFVARESAVGFGLPFLSYFSLSLIAAAMPLFVLSAWMRRRSRKGAEEPPAGQ